MNRQSFDLQEDCCYDTDYDISDVLLEFDALGEHNEELSYLSQSE